jgi:hypothetical protein
MVKLDKADPALRESAGEQAVGGERAVAAFRAIEVENMAWLTAHIHQIRHAGLHAKREFILTNARLDFGIGKALVGKLVERAHGADHIVLLRGRHAVWIADIQNGGTGAAKLDALVLARQKARMPLPCGNRLFLAEVAGGHQNDKSGQVVTFRTQPILQPRAHRWPTRVDRAGVHERVRGVVIDRVGVQ